MAILVIRTVKSRHRPFGGTTLGYVPILTTGSSMWQISGSWVGNWVISIDCLPHSRGVHAQRNYYSSTSFPLLFEEMRGENWRSALRQGNSGNDTKRQRSGNVISRSPNLVAILLGGIASLDCNKPENYVFRAVRWRLW